MIVGSFDIKNRPEHDRLAAEINELREKTLKDVSGNENFKKFMAHRLAVAMVAEFKAELQKKDEDGKLEKFDNAGFKAKIKDSHEFNAELIELAGKKVGDYADLKEAFTLYKTALEKASEKFKDEKREINEDDFSDEIKLSEKISDEEKDQFSGHVKSVQKAMHDLKRYVNEDVDTKQGLEDELKRKERELKKQHAPEEDGFLLSAKSVTRAERKALADEKAKELEGYQPVIDSYAVRIAASLELMKRWLSFAPGFSYFIESESEYAAKEFDELRGHKVKDILGKGDLNVNLEFVEIKKPQKSDLMCATLWKAADKAGQVVTSPFRGKEAPKDLSIATFLKEGEEAAAGADAGRGSPTPSDQ